MGDKTSGNTKNLTTFFEEQTRVFERFIAGDKVSLVLRWFILGGAVLRLLFASGFEGGLDVIYWIVAVIAYAIYTLIVTYVVLSKPKKYFKRSVYMQIAVELIVLSTFYTLSSTINSDFYLFYILPILLAVDNLEEREALVAFLITSLVFVLSTFVIWVFFAPDLGFSEVFIRGFLPRWTFFLLFLFVSLFRGNVLNKQTIELAAIQRTFEEIIQNTDLASRLKGIMDVSAERLNAKGCKVYLNVPSQQHLELVSITGLESEKLKPGYIVEYGQGLAGRVFVEDKPIIENNYRESPNRIIELEDLFEAVVEVPLKFGSEKIGVLAVFDDIKNREFTATSDVYELQRVANYISVAIKDYQRVSDERSQTKSLTTLIEASKEINSKFDLGSVNAEFARFAFDLCEIHDGRAPLFSCVLIADDSQNTLEIVSAYPADHYEKIVDKLGKIDLKEDIVGLTGEAFLKGESIVSRDIRKTTNYIPYLDETNSEVAILIEYESRKIGILNLEARELGAFSDKLVRNLKLLATIGASAIVNAELFQSKSVQSSFAKALLNSSSILANAKNEEDFGKKVLSEFRKLFSFDSGTFQLISGDERKIAARYNIPPKMINNHLLRPLSEDAVVRPLLERNEPFVANSIGKVLGWEKTKTTEDINSWMCIPLVYGNRPLGLITLDGRQEEMFRDVPMELIRVFAAQISNTLENVKLLREYEMNLVELTQKKNQLEGIYEYFDDVNTLFLIGRIYGEDFHFAKAKLGLSLSQLNSVEKDISRVKGTGKAKSNLAKIRGNIKEYINRLNESRRRILREPIPRPVDVHALLDSVINSKAASHQYEITSSFEANEATVVAPEQNVRSVFFVIVDNAFKAMKPGTGKLEIVTRNKVIDGIKYLEVELKDNGPGIPPNIQGRIFSPELKRGRSGTGLGLPWARSYLRVGGGDLYFDTSVLGTSFFVLLPLVFAENIN